MLLLNLQKANKIILRDKITKTVFAKISLATKEGNPSYARICFDAPESTEIVREEVLKRSVTSL